MLNFIKQFFPKRKKWDEVLFQIIETQQNKIVFPVILFEENKDKEFSVFKEGKELINESIFGHWSGVSPICPKLKAFIVDATGKAFEIENEIYDKEYKVCYSYPKKQIGEFSLTKLKNKITNACNEYIEIFGEENKEELLKGKRFIEKSRTILEVIEVTNKELGFL